MTPDELEAKYPDIRWRTPVAVHTSDRFVRLGCRFCIAMNGLKESEVKYLPTTFHAFSKHMTYVHQRQAELL